MPNKKDAIIRFKKMLREYERLNKEYFQRHRNNNALFDSIFRMTYVTKMLKNETLTDTENAYFNARKDKFMEEVYAELKKPMVPLLSVKPDEGRELERVSSSLEEVWGKSLAEEFFTKHPDLHQQRVEHYTKQRRLEKKEERKEKVVNIASYGIAGLLFLVAGIIGIALALVFIYILVLIGFF